MRRQVLEAEVAEAAGDGKVALPQRDGGAVALDGGAGGNCIKIGLPRKMILSKGLLDMTSAEGGRGVPKKQTKGTTPAYL